uniref:DUF2330 domain-containing protein n=1 Tax=candidate division WOR-3 bacterium TaxID=2052148 RepID=A0A7C4TAZ1_UNCW3
MKKLFLPAIIITLIWADGGVVPPIYHEIYGADQVSVIKILPDSEELSILVKFGWTVDYYGFAWVVPFPSLPSIREIDDSLFIDLSKLSSTRRTYGGCGPYYGEGYDYGGDYFQIVAYQTIGFLQTVLIQTDDPDTLVNYLIDNGYQLPDGMRDMFQDYINRQWHYFFIARVDTTAYNYENNIGICFKFATDKIVYPMKISSLTSINGISVYLYVIGQHKMFFDGAELLYANRLSETELENIKEDFSVLFNYVKEGDYITKLRRFYEHHQDMTSDITLYQSPDDTEFRKEEEPEWYMGLGNSMLLPIFVFFLLIMVMKIKKLGKSRTGPLL